MPPKYIKPTYKLTDDEIMLGIFDLFVRNTDSDKYTSLNYRDYEAAITKWAKEQELDLTEYVKDLHKRSIDFFYEYMEEYITKKYKGEKTVKEMMDEIPTKEAFVKKLTQSLVYSYFNNPELDKSEVSFYNEIAGSMDDDTFIRTIEDMDIDWVDGKCVFVKRGPLVAPIDKRPGVLYSTSFGSFFKPREEILVDEKEDDIEYDDFEYKDKSPELVEYVYSMVVIDTPEVTENHIHKNYPKIAAIRYKKDNPKTFLTDQQILQECISLFPSYNNIMDPTLLKLIKDGFQAVYDDITLIERLVDEMYDYGRFFEQLLNEQYFFDTADVLEYRNSLAAEKWLNKNKQTEDSKVIDEPMYIPHVRRTFPKTIIKSESSVDQKPELNDASKEEVKGNRNHYKLPNSESSDQTPIENDFKDFFSHRALTTDDCLKFLQDKFPGCITRKMDSFYVRIPNNVNVEQSKESSYQINSIDRIGDSLVRKYGVSFHPGHGGIEERNCPYYHREIVKALKSAGWM